jgi:hypothetical protein
MAVYVVIETDLAAPHLWYGKPAAGGELNRAGRFGAMKAPAI